MQTIKIRIEQSDDHAQIMHKIQFPSSFNRGSSMIQFFVACVKSHLQKIYTTRPDILPFAG